MLVRDRSFQEARNLKVGSIKAMNVSIDSLVGCGTRARALGQCWRFRCGEGAQSAGERTAAQARQYTASSPGPLAPAVERLPIEFHGRFHLCTYLVLPRSAEQFTSNRAMAGMARNNADAHMRRYRRGARFRTAVRFGRLRFGRRDGLRRTQQPQELGVFLLEVDDRSAFCFAEVLLLRCEDCFTLGELQSILQEQLSCAIQDN
jgi:hypothetical protein